MGAALFFFAQEPNRGKVSHYVLTKFRMEALTENAHENAGSVNRRFRGLGLHQSRGWNDCEQSDLILQKQTWSQQGEKGKENGGKGQQW